MSSNWQDALLALRQDGNLPESEEPVSAEPAAPAAKKGKLAIAMEKKGRGGKTVTIISGFKETHEEVAAVAAQLKVKLGTGGSARGGEILIQGDRREQIKSLLLDLGYKV